MLLLAGFLAGSMLLTPAGAHFTQNTQHLGRHAWHQVIKDKVYTRNQIDQNIRMWARVSSDGNLVQKRGPVHSAVKDSAGTYVVRFNRAVLGCSAQATAWSATQRTSPTGFSSGPGVLPFQFASVGAFFPTGDVSPTPPDPRRLVVALSHPDAGRLDGAFTLHVVC